MKTLIDEVYREPRSAQWQRIGTLNQPSSRRDMHEYQMKYLMNQDVHTTTMTIQKQRLRRQQIICNHNVHTILEYLQV